MSPSFTPFAIGVDGGGTHTRARCRTLAPILGPPSNASVLGPEAASRVIADLVRRLEPPPGARLFIAAGVAGAAPTGVRRALQSSLSTALGIDTGQCEVISDAELALDAGFGLDMPGVVLISGTGSIALARDASGELDRTGGWGPLLGDRGAGHSIGLRGLGAVADALDGGPPTRLTDYAAERWHAPDAEHLRREVYVEKRPPASFAPAVLDACDELDAVACAIIDAEVAAIVTRVRWLTRRHDRAPRQVACFGGLMDRPTYLGRIRAALRDAAPGWSLVPPKSSPVDAALLRAEELAVGGR